MHKGQRNSGQFQPGQSGNPAGRPKGRKNKFTKDMKETFREVFGIALKSFQEDLQSMEPDKRWNIILKGMRYVVPTKQEVKNKVSGEMKIEVSFEEMLNSDVPKTD